MTTTKRYSLFKKWLNEETRKVGEVHQKLHELYDEENPEDNKEINNLFTKSELYVFYH